MKTQKIRVGEQRGYSPTVVDDKIPKTQAEQAAEVLKKVRELNDQKIVKEG